MKFRCTLTIAVFLLLICSLNTVFSEPGQEAVIIPDNEWSWSRGAYNTFSGQIDLSDCTGEELTISISADLPYDTDSEQMSMPVFTSVNGKRIVMTKQSDTVQITPENGDGIISFSASFRLPEKKNVEKASFVFSVKDQNGQELKTVSGFVEAAADQKGKAQNPFYIPVSINTITIILTIAAVLVWIIVIVRRTIGPKTQKTGE
ncbi:MAG: hypothetical protein IKG23_00760 [Clostridia bacterium]|nr:hypothetical protein [Clostridia bacterium]